MSIIGDNIPASAYNIWFANIRPQKFAEQVLWLAIPSQFVYEYIEEHYIDLLYATICRVFGENTDLMYRVQIDKANELSVDQESANRRASISQPQTSAARKSTNKAPGPISVATQDAPPQLQLR